MPSQEDTDRYPEDLSGDEEIESTFRRLRADGYSRLEALRVILDVLDVSLKEAKTILLTSETWDEARAKVTRDQATRRGDESAYGESPPPAPAD